MHTNAEAADDYAFLTRLSLPSRGGTTDHVQAALRDAIVSADLPPGTFINKHDVCERLGVSRFPVSEALTRLQAEGLVEILPQRGTRVSRIRVSDVRESMFLRRALEAEAVRQLARAMPAGLVADLERNMRHQTAAIEASDPKGFHILDLEFHQLIVDALGYPRVRTLVEAARGGLERARRLLSSPWRHSATLREHEAILAALKAGEPDAAAAAMLRHLDTVVEVLLDYGRSHPEVVEEG